MLSFARENYVRNSSLSEFLSLGIISVLRKPVRYRREYSFYTDYIIKVFYIFWFLDHKSVTMEDDKLEYELRGKAWRVYWLLLRTDCPMSIREVQRALHFSSPSVANHHLEKLRELGLVEKDYSSGGYSLVGEVKIGVLRHFVKIGKLMFPRYFFYAVFSTTFYVSYILVLMQDFTRENLFILLFGGIVLAIFWYEALRFWRLKPF